MAISSSPPADSSAKMASCLENPILVNLVMDTWLIFGAVGPDRDWVAGLDGPGAGAGFGAEAAVESSVLRGELGRASTGAGGWPCCSTVPVRAPTFVPSGP